MAFHVNYSPRILIKIGGSSGEKNKYSKTCVKRPLSKRPKIVFQDLMQVKSIAEDSAILSAFIKLPFVIKIFVCLFLSGRFTQVLLQSLLRLIRSMKQFL